MATKRLASAPHSGWGTTFKHPFIKAVTGTLLGASIGLAVMERKNAAFEHAFEDASKPAVVLNQNIQGNLTFVMLDKGLQETFFKTQSPEIIANAMYVWYVPMIEEVYTRIDEKTANISDPFFYGEEIRARNLLFEHTAAISGTPVTYHQLWVDFLFAMQDATQTIPSRQGINVSVQTMQDAFGETATANERTDAQRTFMNELSRTKHDDIIAIFKKYVLFEIAQTNKRNSIITEHKEMYKEPIMAGLLAAALCNLALFASTLRRKLKKMMESVTKTMVPPMELQTIHVDAMLPPEVEEVPLPPAPVILVRKAVTPKPLAPVKKAGDPEERRAYAQMDKAQLIKDAKEELLSRIGPNLTTFLFERLDTQMTTNAMLNSIIEGNFSKLHALIQKSKPLLMANGFADIDEIINRLN